MNDNNAYKEIVLYGILIYIYIYKGKYEMKVTIILLNLLLIFKPFLIKIYFTCIHRYTCVHTDTHTRIERTSMHIN